MLTTVGVAVRSKDWVTAIAAVDRLLDASPEDCGSQTQALQVYLQSGEVARAARLAASAQCNWDGNPRLAHLSLLALGRSGDRIAAASAARAALRSAPTELRLVAAAADALIQAGYASEAVAALEAALKPEADDARAWYELGRARHLLGEREAALAAVRRALDLDPKGGRARELAARILFDLAQPTEALAELGMLAEAQQNSTALFTQIEAHVACGQFDSALPLIRKLAADRPESFVLTRRLTGLLGQHGELDLAREVYSANLAVRRSQLPASFAAGVAPLLARPVAQNELLPQARLGWLWHQLEAAGKAPKDRVAWEQEVVRVARLDRYILDWIECRPEALRETAAIMASTRAARNDVAKALAKGRGVVLAAGHVGMLFGSVAAIALADLPMAFVSSAPDLGNPAYDGHLISSTSLDNAGIGRAIYRALRAGKAVSVAIEGSKAAGKELQPLFDRQIELSSFVPGLAWKTGTPSFFPFMFWNGRKAKITLRRLPDPDGYASVEEYRSAWTRAYLSALETALLNHPGSARASGGFWGSIVL